MQLGVISDIHGNSDALQAAWTLFEQENLTEAIVLNAGDSVGYGDDPEGCARFLQAHPNIVTVQGNYDKHAARFPEKQAEYRKKWGKSRPEKLAAIARDSETISDETRAWLLALPEERELTLEGHKVILTHYAPGSKEGLGRWTPDARLAELASRTDAQIVVCGHTHTPFARSVGGILWLNPGTLGRSYFASPPAFAVLTLIPDAPPTAELRRLK